MSPVTSAGNIILSFRARTRLSPERSFPSSPAATVTDGQLAAPDKPQSAEIQQTKI